MEVSSKLSQLQAEALCVTSEANDSNSLSYRSGVSHSGIPVHWYYSFQDVPRQFSCVVAHEFFDALPIHKFQVNKIVKVKMFTFLYAIFILTNQNCFTNFFTYGLNDLKLKLHTQTVLK